MFPAALSFAKTTSFLPEHNALLRKAMGVLNLFAWSAGIRSPSK